PEPAEAAVPGSTAPLPRASLSLRILAALAMVYTLWAAQDLVLPILLAMFFALVGNPIIRVLRRLWIPRPLAAVLLVLAGIAGVAMLGRQLVEPAMAWVEQVPREMRQLAPK